MNKKIKQFSEQAIHDDKYYREIEEHRQECEADFKEQQSEECWYANSLGDGDDE